MSKQSLEDKKLHEDCVPYTNNFFKVGHLACIWICYDCGEMFDGELCTGFTGQCYECYPRPDEMREAKY